MPLIIISKCKCGPVDTPLWHAKGQLGDQLAGATGMKKDEAIDWFAKANIPMGRYAKAEEIASAVLFLSSVPAHYITGVAINVDCIVWRYIRIVRARLILLDYLYGAFAFGEKRIGNKGHQRIVYVFRCTGLI